MDDEAAGPTATVAETSGQNNTRVLVTIASLVLLYVFSKWLKSYHEPTVHVDDYRESSRHHWQFSDLILQPILCNVCHNLLLTSKGKFCSNCGIGCCLNSDCLRKANLAHVCKEVATTANSSTNRRVGPELEVDDAPNPDGQPNENSDKKGQGRKFRHHWINGNLPLNSTCEVCDECCGDGPGIVDMRCCWCQRTVHNQCHPQLSEICDFGTFRQFIVPPFSVKTLPKKRVMKPSVKRRTIVEVTPPTYSNVWRPLIVIGNRKSGNNDGSAILAAFRAQLNPAQVVDLGETRMEDGLEWCEMIGSGGRCTCLVAGGDGTIGWVLNTIDRMGLEHPPALCIVPLGTGNDLSRALGFGPGADAGLNVRETMNQLLSAKDAHLDRWKVVVNPAKHFGIRLPSQTLYMQNYLSIGVDALVTYNFHKARESPFYLLSSRFINKLIYFSYGTKDVLERECKDLDQILDLYMDDVRIELPSIESVVVLNIPFWGGGVKPWDLGTGHSQYRPQSYDDGLLEVFCVFSSFHIAQMQVGLSEPHRIGQAKKVRIVLHGSAPMQTDGEPWEQHPAEILIEFHKKVPILHV